MLKTTRCTLAIIFMAISSPAQASSVYRDLVTVAHQELSGLVVAHAFRSFVYQPFTIPSGSMKPALLPGDYVFVSKPAYGYSRFSFPAPDMMEPWTHVRTPDRGDVVVFKHPQKDQCSGGPVGTALRAINNVAAVFGLARFQAQSHDCVDYVKRVIGVPGDTVEMKDGVLYLNDIPVRREKIAPYRNIKGARGHHVCMNDPVPVGGVCEVEQWIEKMPNGRSYAVLELGITRYDTFDPVTVKPGMIFVMGDNRDNSVDSRFPNVGQVPIDNLIGRAKVIAFSSRGPIWKIHDWRIDRLWKSVR